MTYPKGMANQLKTILLLSALSVLLITIGGAISPTMLVVMIAFAVVVNVGAFLHSDKLVLRMSRARVVERHEAPGLCDVIRELADRAQLPMPRGDRVLVTGVDGTENDLGTDSSGTPRSNDWPCP